MFARVAVASAVGSFGDQVVGKFLKQDQRARRVEIENIRVLFAVERTVRMLEQARILRAERRLHIQRGTADGTEHHDGCPFGDRHAGRELSDRQCDSFVIVPDRSSYTVKCRIQFFFCFRLVLRFAVAGGEDDFILPEHGVLFQLFLQRFRAVHAVQQPQRVF